MKQTNSKTKIVFVGGGSGGPVAPLLALVEYMQEQKSNFEPYLVGTKHGPELQMAKEASIPFYSIVSGKLRRYFSLKNLFTPFQLIFGFFQALRLLKKIRPGLVMGAGSFVQVPVCYAARFLKIPVIIHQQDVEKSLSNSLCAMLANKITTTFPETAKLFSEGVNLFAPHDKQKVFCVGNPVRKSVLIGSKEEARKFFKFNDKKPVILIVGGGTGAKYLNKLVLQSLNELIKHFQIIHITGKGKGMGQATEGYFATEFLPQMNLAYALADIVVARSGLSTISELSRLKKISILIPMKNTHQETNAEYLFEKGAALVYDEQEFTPVALVKLSRTLILEANIQKQLSTNIAAIMPQQSEKQMLKIINQVIA